MATTLQSRAVQALEPLDGVVDLLLREQPAVGDHSLDAKGDVLLRERQEGAAAEDRLLLLSSRGFLGTSRRAWKKMPADPANALLFFQVTDAPREPVLPREVESSPRLGSAIRGAGRKGSQSPGKHGPSDGYNADPEPIRLRKSLNCEVEG